MAAAIGAFFFQFHAYGCILHFFHLLGFRLEYD